MSLESFQCAKYIFYIYFILFYAHTHTHVLSYALFHRVCALSSSFLFSPSLTSYVEACRYNCAVRQLRNSYFTDREAREFCVRAPRSFLTTLLSPSPSPLSLSVFRSPVFSHLVVYLSRSPLVPASRDVEFYRTALITDFCVTQSTFRVYTFHYALVRKREVNSALERLVFNFSPFWCLRSCCQYPCPMVQVGANIVET